VTSEPRVAVDTNVLFRVLADDPGNPEQCRRARAAVSAAQSVWVPLVVLVELVWVLDRAAELTRSEITELIDHLLANRAFELEAESQIRLALAEWRLGAADFADYLVLTGARLRSAPLLSFDRRLARADGVRALD
jgi:predicted nucleic-acid-binding protein